MPSYADMAASTDLTKELHSGSMESCSDGTMKVLVLRYVQHASWSIVAPRMKLHGGEVLGRSRTAPPLYAQPTRLQHNRSITAHHFARLPRRCPKCLHRTLLVDISLPWGLIIGMEVAGVVLGVVPIVVEAIKAWRIIHHKLRVFRYYAREIKRIYDKLRVQSCIFDNEIEALLTASGLRAGVVQEMIADPGHQGWANPSNIDRITTQLGKDHDVYLDLLQSISSSLAKVQSELTSFDHLIEHKGKVRELVAEQARSPAVDSLTRAKGSRMQSCA